MAPELRKAEAILTAAVNREQRLEQSEAKKLKTKENKEASKRHLESLSTPEEKQSYKEALKKQRMDTAEEKNIIKLNQEKKRGIGVGSFYITKIVRI